MRSFNTTIDYLFFELNGLGAYSKNRFLKRFEFGYFKYKEDKNLASLSLDNRKILNMYIAKMGNVNYDISALLRYNLVRLYLIKSFRGKAQAIGKPSRGQRT
jgi:ribosomal protein S13